ncbi:MAG TPA: hypothetical protein VIA80_16785 [Hyphomonadaceae bacterium]
MDPRESSASIETSAGEAAFQVLEMLLLTLIDKKIIEPHALIAEIESLASENPDIGRRPSSVTVGGRLSVPANSLSAYANTSE